MFVFASVSVSASVRLVRVCAYVCMHAPVAAHACRCAIVCVRASVRACACARVLRAHVRARVRACALQAWCVVGAVFVHVVV